MSKILLFLGIFFLGAGVSQFTTLLLSHKSNIVLNKSSLVTQEILPTTFSHSDSEQDTDTTITKQTKILEEVKVTRIIDGDTVELSDGRKLRYIGIDTPELVNPSTPSECFGADAKAQNNIMVYSKTVRLEKDVSETDRFGRLLRYVYVGPPDGEASEIFVNDYLVRYGFAHASTFPPDVKYSKQFLEAEREARENNRGLWGGCTSNATNPTNEAPIVLGDSNVMGNSCQIKGNISTGGEKIYHTPGCGSYEKTVIDETRGENWFCTENEAIDMGFRKAKNC